MKISKMVNKRIDGRAGGSTGWREVEVSFTEGK